MAAFTTVFPIFFVLGLGLISRIRGWITPEQKAGAYSVIIKVLFPLLIFKLMASTKFELSHLSIVVYVTIAYVLTLALAKLMPAIVGEKFAGPAKFLLMTNEGGNVALPLYLSIVGASSNTLIFDLGGTLTCFVILPIIVAKQTAQSTGMKDLLKSIFSSSFILAVLAGLFVNFTGLYTLMETSVIGPAIIGALDNATAPIIGTILFCLGYDLQIDATTLAPILKLCAVRVAYFSLVIAGSFVLFPHLMADPVFETAVILYFMCPTGFGLPPIIAPVIKNREQEEFISSFISIFMIITLIVYAGLVIFVA